MTVLQGIQTWAKGLPTWQQLAITKLSANLKLSDDDVSAIYQALRVSVGLKGETNQAAETKSESGESTLAKTGNPLIKLLSIKNLKNVNALAENQTLEIAASGLTVIYGDNGAGKSGYSRVLKKACRARDQSEQILANADKPPGSCGPAEATFEFQVADNKSEIVWKAGSGESPLLESVSIFDSHCARAYIDNRGDFAYTPYGLQVLEVLALLCAKMKALLTQEISTNTPNLEPFVKLGEIDTPAGKFAGTLSCKSELKVLEQLITLSGPELDRSSTLRKVLSEADPSQRAKELRLRATRIRDLALRMTLATASVGDQSIADLKRLILDSSSAQGIAEIAAKRFQEDSTLLPATGSEPWKTLFESAQAFIAHSHPEQSLSTLSAFERCPLCQNPIGEAGARRLAQFDVFISAEAEKTAKAARKSAVSAYRAIEDAKVALGIDETLKTDLAQQSETLVTVCNSYQERLVERRQTAMAACKPGGDWNIVSSLPQSPAAALTTVAEQCDSEAQLLIASSDASARVALNTEFLGLRSRQDLADLRSTALEAIAKLQRKELLEKGLSTTNSTPISRKATEIVRTIATEEVAAALNTELEGLGAEDLRIVMRPETAKGKAQFKLIVERAAGIPAAAILSEGEQRAISIASFLAEAKLSAEHGALVFDDPVSSLDHTRRERVASRLASAAKDRQIVVFTHDIFFLGLLLSECERRGTSVASRNLVRAPQGFGVVSNTLPFQGARTKERIGLLRNAQVECARLHKASDSVGYGRCVRELYSMLRMAWERAVEELLFSEVVVRFRKGIETNRLKQVTVEPSDVVVVESNMGKCSNYTGHDVAAEANPGLPSPADLSRDIEALEGWRETLAARKRQ